MSYLGKGQFSYDIVTYNTNNEDDGDDDGDDDGGGGDGDGDDGDDDDDDLKSKLRGVIHIDRIELYEV